MKREIKRVRFCCNSNVAFLRNGHADARSRRRADVERHTAGIVPARRAREGSKNGDF